MHPVIRVACLLVILIAASTAIPYLLYALFILILLLYGFTPGAEVQSSFRMLRRIRWLILALLILYSWFTPGLPLFDSAYSAWLPTYDGVYQAAIRIFALVIIVLYVSFVMTITKQEDLVGALYWLSKPLVYFGVSPERLLIRLMLTFKLVGDMEQLFSQSTGKQTIEGPVWQRWTYRISHVFDIVITRAETTVLETVSMEIMQAPSLRHWLIPVILSIVLIFIASLYF